MVFENRVEAASGGEAQLGMLVDTFRQALRDDHMDNVDCLASRLDAERVELTFKRRAGDLRVPLDLARRAGFSRVVVTDVEVRADGSTLRIQREYWPGEGRAWLSGAAHTVDSRSRA